MPFFAALALFFASLGSIALAQQTVPFPGASPSPSASPSPAASTPPEIGGVRAEGRKDNLVGKASSASQGTISQAQIETRPIARPGEVLEAIPGVIITQHSGEGRANQYYLRGFQLDHGTDLSATVLGQPMTFRPRPRPRLLGRQLAAAGAGQLRGVQEGPVFRRRGRLLDRRLVQSLLPQHDPRHARAHRRLDGFGRILLAGSPKLGAGTLLYGLEAYHNDGTFERPDNYRRLNGVLRYSRSGQHRRLQRHAARLRRPLELERPDPATLRRPRRHRPLRPDRPQRRGRTYRYALSTQFEHRSGNTTTKFSAYAIRYSLDLFSDFTYALDDATDYFNVTANPVTCKPVYSTCAPGANHVAGYTAFCPANAAPPAPGGAPQPFAFACGDQREQQDRRFVTGFRLARTWQTATASNTLGLGLRNDNIANVALFLDTARSRTPDGSLTIDDVVEREVNAYLQTEQRLGPKLRLTAGFGELYRFDVHVFDPVNSGVRTAGLVLPKLSFAYRASPSGEFYLSAGESFHSNDGRGTTVTGDPDARNDRSHRRGGGTRLAPGARERRGDRLPLCESQTQHHAVAVAAGHRLGVTFSGDAGTTSAGRPTVRKGIELTNFYTPTRNLTIDADFSFSIARFTTDPGGIEPAFPRRSPRWPRWVSPSTARPMRLACACATSTPAT